MPADSSTSPDVALAMWTQHEPELRRWLAARSSSSSEVEDLLQETFIKLLRQCPSLTEVEKPRAWLFKVARNTWIDRLRSRDHHIPLPEDFDEWATELTEAPVLIDALAQACLPRVLSELDPQDREAIELCDLQGMTQADFARLKGLSLPAAKSRVQRARQRMRSHMTRACQISFNDAGLVDDFVPRLSAKDDTPSSDFLDLSPARSHD